MKFDAMLLSPDLLTIGEYAKSAETLGFDGLFISETNSDPFLSLAISAEHTQSLALGTGIAVAFPRTPNILAMLAWDLARLSGGRFTLGLGTQVRAHNERRLGVKWEKPVRKMRETIEAIHAFWDCWQDGTPLRYKGEFFNLSLMTPFFTPPPLPTGKPPIYISAVNKLMLRLVGKRCDGVFLHAFHTKPYIEQFARPQIAVGLAQAGRTWEDVAVTTGIFVIPTDDDDKPTSHFEQFTKQQISFYMSTPAYRVVSEMHGWEATALQLSQRARKGDWGKMPTLITDNILDEIALTGKWSELPHKIHARYGNLLDRVSYYLPYTPHESVAGWQATIASFNKIG